MVYTLDSIGEGNYPMAWKPSEGLRRADLLAADIHCAIIETGGVITPLGRHHMVDVIAKAIDAALEASAQPSLPLGNGFHPEPIETEADDSMVSEANEAAALTLAGETVYGAPGGPHDTLAAAMDALPEAKKRRGRPKGSKGKKAKAAKAKREALYDTTPAPSEEPSAGEA